MQETGSGVVGVVFGLVWLAVMILIIAGIWKTFTKAGKPGWASLIPIYNVVVLLQIVGRPLWFLVLLLIPIVNLVALVIIALDLAKSFGKGAGYGVGIAFLGFIFVPLLGFGDNRYQGPAHQSPAAA